MIIGCVKEIKNNEFRVGLTPDNCKSYVKAGHRVLIEKGAGEGSGFLDEEYEKAGAEVLSKAGDVWNRSEMIVKVKEPLEEEYGYFREGLIIYTYFHLAAEPELTEKLLEKKVKSVAYETLIEKDGSLPLLAPMSQIAGRLSVQEGARLLEKPHGGAGILLAGVPGVARSKVTVLGGGTVGTNAARIAVGIGADVTVIDMNIKRLEYLDDIFDKKIQTLYSTDSNIEKAVIDSDLVIGSVLIPGGSAPKLFKKEYLKKMRPGSVFVDVAIDQGGCGECSHQTSHDDPTFTVDGVIHYCVGNMPGAVPRTSTFALTNATLRYGLQIAGAGLEEACRKNNVIYSAVNTYDGCITCENVANSFPQYPYKEIRELIG